MLRAGIKKVRKKGYSVVPFKIGCYLFGSPYLEVHHVKTLAEGGPDTPNNTVAICPNCHSALHHSEDADELREKIYKQVKRLTLYM